MTDLGYYMENGRFKEGLARCTKSLKKSPTDVRLLIWKTRFALGMGDRDGPMSTLNELCNRKPAIADLNLVQDLDDLASEIQAGEYPRPLALSAEMGTLWMNAAKEEAKFPRKKTANKRRFENAVRWQRWEDVNAALLQLRRENPKDDGLRLAHIAIRQLCAENLQDPTKKRINFMLADKDLDLANPSAMGVAEDELRMTILRRRKRFDEISRLFLPLDLNQIHYPHFFTDAKLRKGCIESLYDGQYWGNLGYYCNKLLNRGDNDAFLGANMYNAFRDDWFIWNGYLRACLDIPTPHIPPLIEEFAATGNRPARIALIEYHLRRELKITQDALEALQKYFDAYRSERFCFDDLKDLVLLLPVDAQVKFRQFVAQAAKDASGGDSMDKKRCLSWFMTEINALKFEYLLTIGNSAQPCEEYSVPFATNCIRLIKLAEGCSIDTPPEIYYLAVSALRRAGKSSLLQAACLLEHGINKLKPRHQAAAMLVYLETELGFHSLAAQHYDSLSVKEIQQDTVSHMLLTRISLHHPHAFPRQGGADLDPTKIINKALKMYEATTEKLGTAQQSLLRNGQADLFFEIQALRHSLDRSFTRRMLILEGRRIARLTDQPTTPLPGPRVPESWWDNLSNNRDWNTTFNYESRNQGLPLEAGIHASGNMPHAGWIFNALHVDDTCDILLGRPPLFGENGMDDKLCRSAPPGTVAENGVLEMEHSLAVRFWTSLRIIVSGMRWGAHPQYTLAHKLQMVTDTVRELPISSDGGAEAVATIGSPACTALLRNCYLLLDALKAGWRFTAFAADWNKSQEAKKRLSVAKIEELKAVVQRQFDAVHKRAVVMKGRMKAEAVLEAIKSGEVGQTLEMLEWRDELGGSWMEAFAERAARSAEEAWDGVIRIKLK